MSTGKILTISLSVIAVSVIVVIGFANNAYTQNSNLQDKNPCQHALSSIKAFDDQKYPKYFTGSGYTVMPLDLTTTNIHFTSPCG
jgi:hypothetical protein